MLYRLGMLNGRHFVSHQRETRVPLFKVTREGEIIGMASVGHAVCWSWTSLILERGLAVRTSREINSSRSRKTHVSPF